MDTAPIIPPVSAVSLEAELTPEHLLTACSRGDNQVYLVDNQCAPAVLREIGRLREITFRNGGGGTGKEMDLDCFDLEERFHFKQLVLWDPTAREIVGGYRLTECDKCLFDENGQPMLPSAHLFTFSEEFIHDYLPMTIELSRSFVTPEHQSSKDSLKRNIYALDNLLEAISVYTATCGKEYLFGKATIYPDYEGLGILLSFLQKHFGEDSGHLVVPKKPVPFPGQGHYTDVLDGESFAADLRILKGLLRREGIGIPPLISTYMQLSQTMKFFGAGVNDEFGDVIEAGLLVRYKDIVKARYQHSSSIQ